MSHRSFVAVFSAMFLGGAAMAAGSSYTTASSVPMLCGGSAPSGYITPMAVDDGGYLYIQTSLPDGGLNQVLANLPDGGPLPVQVTQPLPAGTAVIGKVGIDSTTTGGLCLDATVGKILTSKLPGVPTTLTMVASTSNAVTALTAGSCVWFSCSVDANYRQGTTTPTAVSTDNQLPANTLVHGCLGASNTAVAFITSAAGTCYVGVEVP